MASNSTLAKAKKNQHDEYYTQLTDIEKELKHYKEHFENKVIFCNCDDPEESNFWKYFNLNFDKFKLKKLITTHYEKEKQSYMLEMYRDENGVHSEIKTLKQNGDFRSPECIELLKEADIVITNPPFSLFREYVTQLMEYDKKFLIIGRPDVCNYKGFFQYIIEEKMWMGYKSPSEDMLFDVNEDFAKWLKENKKENSGYKIVDGVLKGRAPAVWWTNLDIKKRHEQIILGCNSYTSDKYPKFDNYDAINVQEINDIPYDYYGVMGVPVTYLYQHCPDQFEIIGITLGRAEFSKEGNPTKRYKKAKQHSYSKKDCAYKTTNGSKTNTGASIRYVKKEDLPTDKSGNYKTYYTAENVIGYLQMKYPRVLIRRIKIENDDE